MSPALEHQLIKDDAFDTSLDAIEAFEELERRRRLVQEGKSRLMGEDESWAFLKSAGCHV